MNKINIEIELEEYVRLLNVDAMMDTLEVLGIDNWEGYGMRNDPEFAPELHTLKDFTNHEDIVKQ